MVEVIELSLDEIRQIAESYNETTRLLIVQRCLSEGFDWWNLRTLRDRIIKMMDEKQTS